MISRSIAQLFKKIPQLGVNPDEAIARGAAIQAALIFRNQHLDEVILTDVMPFSLGTDTSINLGNGRMSHGHFSPILDLSVICQFLFLVLKILLLLWIIKPKLNSVYCKVNHL